LGVTNRRIEIISGGAASGEPFRLARGYAPDMVLQMEPKSAHLWGRGEAGAEVTLAFGQVQLTTTITGHIHAKILYF